MDVEEPDSSPREAEPVCNIYHDYTTLHLFVPYVKLTDGSS
jgi:hypothetical protein